MPISFSQTTESLKKDHFQPFVLWCAVVVVVLALWLAWFIAWPMPVYAYGREGRLLADGETNPNWSFSAAFSAADALGRIEIGAPATVALDGFAPAEFGRLTATVRARQAGVEKGRSRLWFDIDPTAFKAPLEPGLTGQVRVLIGQATPWQRVSAALGHHTATPGATP